jgi:hypothetical protein
MAMDSFSLFLPSTSFSIGSSKWWSNHLTINRIWKLQFFNYHFILPTRIKCKNMVI